LQLPLPLLGGRQHVPSLLAPNIMVLCPPQGQLCHFARGHFRLLQPC
jgi:hypothetical protein